MEAAGFAGGWWGDVEHWRRDASVCRCFPAIDLILVTVASSTSSQMGIFRGAVMRQRGSLLFCFHQYLLYCMQQKGLSFWIQFQAPALFCFTRVQVLSRQFRCISPPTDGSKSDQGEWRGVTPPRADEQEPFSGGCAADTLDHRPRHHRRLFKLHVTWIRIEDACD
jgi:hypothetical protein